jgi:hypothetical protein
MTFGDPESAEPARIEFEKPGERGGWHGMTRPLVRIALGGAIVAVIAIGAVWWTGVLVPNVPNERPQLADTPPLPPVTRSSLIVAPVSIRMTAIQEAAERSVPRDLAGQPDASSLPNIPGLTLTWSLVREPFAVAGASGGLTLSSALRGSLSGSGQLPLPLPLPLPLDQSPAVTGTTDTSPFGFPEMPKELEGQIREFLGPLAPPPRPQRNAKQPPSQDKGQQAKATEQPKATEQRVDVSGQVALSARPNLRPDWRVEPNLTAQVTIADARMSIMGTTVDLSDEMKRVVEGAIGQQVEMMQAQIGNSSMLQEAMQAEWAKMCRSMPLGAGPPGTPDLWLELRPTQAMAAQPRIDADAVTLTVGVRAETRILTAESKPDCPFPSRLDIVPQMDQGQVNIDLPIDIPFVQVNRMIEEQVKGKTFPLDESGAFVATVNSVEVAPSGDRLLMALGIRAKETKTVLGLAANATIYLWGRPVVDRKMQKLRFKDVALDVKSDAAFGALGFAARAAVPYMQKLFADNAEIDLAPTIADARKNIEAAIAEFRQQSSDVQLEAAVTDVSLAGIQFDAKTLRIITSSEGTVRAVITRLSDK